jgi:salicylate hydroxylase
MSANDLRIIIIGGGIGGLTAARALQHFGYRPRVYERAPALLDSGAGVVITPNAMHALDFLGVGERVAREAGPPEQYHTYDIDNNLLEIGPPVDSFIPKYGAGFFTVHRGDLQSALVDAVRRRDPDAIVLNHELINVEQSDSGVTAHFLDRSPVEADVLIGADGGASRVRAVVFGDEEVSYTGQMAFRALVPMADVPLQHLSSPFTLWVGSGRMLLIYPLRNHSELNVIGIAREPRWQAEGWAIPAEVAEFAQLYRDFSPGARAIINAIPEGQLFKWGLRDRDPLWEWTRDRVAMLGDAAHPMTPFLGQGACMAIEDGMVLGRAFNEGQTIAESFGLYERARRERANGVQLASREEARNLQGVVEEGANPGKNAATRGLHAYNPLAVPLGQADVAVDGKASPRPLSERFGNE